MNWIIFLQEKLRWNNPFWNVINWKLTVPALDDEADGGEPHRHEVGDGEDDPRRHELGEGRRVRPVHRGLELDRQACRAIVLREYHC